ncbi:NCS1 nucleoside transporter [Stachybotrys elegans]|uniref:NCS1 nucleoside transporter n=1 Tax=Stachybotrys elegans TaxID=80388 RepID=A0A8K0SDN5_9HYPO|nr:NCS1 nucleoside transporter [Stachybotrys elegans]
MEAASKNDSDKFVVRLRNYWQSSQVENRGIEPIPLEERTSKRYFNAFTLWCSINTNILAVTFGLIGPVSFGLSLRDSSLVIFCFTLLTTLAPAYFSIMGPKTGMRQMVQARYSFGKYLVTIPIVLNLATLLCFSIVICVVGGECLSAVSDGRLSPNIGIVLIAVFALLVSFWGFNVMHFFEGYAWIPALVSIIITVGCGGNQLHLQTETERATAQQILGYGGVIASYMLPWACVASDMTTYFNPTGKNASARIFAYSYLGLFLPTVLLMTLGAAIGGAMANVPAWQNGFEETQVGGVLAAMLSPAGGFGKFIVVLLAFSLLANLSGTMYAITINFQALVPIKLPRAVYSVIVVALEIPLAIEAAVDFFLNIEHLVALIGYWSAAFIGIILVEHFVFRGGNYDLYNPLNVNTASALPSGLAAMGAAVLAFGLVVPCISQYWFTGPIAAITGDIGFEVAFFLSSLLYVPLRWLERRWMGH